MNCEFLDNCVVNTAMVISYYYLVACVPPLLILGPLWVAGSNPTLDTFACRHFFVLQVAGSNLAPDTFLHSLHHNFFSFESYYSRLVPKER